MVPACPVRARTRTRRDHHRDGRGFIPNIHPLSRGLEESAVFDSDDVHQQRALRRRLPPQLGAVPLEVAVLAALVAAPAPGRFPPLLDATLLLSPSS